MLISVVIPSRNSAKTIRKCLDSIACQNFDKHKYEILIALDSCTDDTENVVRAWHEDNTDVVVRMFRCACGSPGGARNVCLDNATGEYVMFVDSDDRLMDDNAMTVLYDAAKGHNAVRVLDHAVSGNMVKYSDRPTIWLYFFARALIGDDRFTEMQLCEDYEFVCRIRAKSGYDETTVDGPLYYYDFDEERMRRRIRDIHSASESRDPKLPPLYVCDGFIPPKARKVLGKWLKG